MIPTETNRIVAILRLRLLVAFLGEKKQHDWWDTSFLDSTGRQFLERTFPRTAFEAALRCASEAARLTHDEQIGRRGAFHLFRLPLEVEDAIEARISQTIEPAWLVHLIDEPSATRELLARLITHVVAPGGPVQIGTESDVLSSESASDMAAHYHSAFARGIRCYPYFGTSRHGRT